MKSESKIDRLFIFPLVESIKKSQNKKLECDAASEMTIVKKSVLGSNSARRKSVKSAGLTSTSFR